MPTTTTPHNANTKTPSVHKAAKVVAMSGCVGAYVHGAVSPGVGMSAGVVALGVVSHAEGGGDGGGAAYEVTEA